DAISPGTRPETAAPSRPRLKVAPPGRASACGWRTTARPATLQPGLNLPWPCRLPDTKRCAGRVNSSLYVPASLVAPRRARSPENVSAFLRGDITRGDEQQVRKAIEIGEKLRVERLLLVQSDRRPLGPANHRSR